MGEQAMDRAAAERFVGEWCANRCKVDIDAVVSHLAAEAEMRSPLLKLTGSPVVAGAEHPRLSAKGVWPRRERGPEILSWSWDAAIARLTVWWQLGEARASEFMDFDYAGRVVRSEAFYGK